ncbi:helix-turn-helix domain-containing protein [Oceanicaulis sp. MMSF_3324]|uniref:helix-turn-helix domain-containing protein n=1 Tax=Oceanicaulis sp. MMSF_3324 TaxID=3046702 RepID=UPI00273F7711|nr:helix-turn-helix domain-containing protein [Oceanicaulis sp. MMSF_3324]
MKFGDYLRSKREEAGWTQPEAAARADIEQSYLSKLETGRSVPSDEVYARLVKAYEIDTAELVNQLDAPEMDRLREIQSVRSHALAQSRRTVNLARGWLMAGVAALVAGGASIGVAVTAEHDEYTEYQYLSRGVLDPEENLRAFDIVDWRGSERPVSGERDPEYDAYLERQREMLTRLDEERRVVQESRGDAFVENLPEGRRYFEQIDQRIRSVPSPLRLFLIPGFALILGALGCFFVGFRWK